ncbi:ABC transporter transmembrane domain-containing protein [Streptomyces sp. NPDC051217]|uniref:ABC transporter transmembrane domain-containing protein n=1 Tax=Streptomyces sp. NPDC051217 TaxID=3365644 RepID=UPI0037B3B245
MFYGIVTMLARSCVPLVTGLIIDRGILGHSQKALLTWGAVMFAVVVLQAATTTLQERCDWANTMRASFRTMQLVNRHAARLGATLRERTSAGEVMNIGVGDITPIGSALAATSRGAGAIVGVVVVAVIMLTSAWQLGLIVLLGTPLIVWLLTKILLPVRRRLREARAQQGALSEIAVDIAGGLRVLRGVGGEEHYAQLFRTESQRARVIATDVARVQGGVAGVRTVLTGVFSLAVVWLAARLVLSGQLQVGELVAFYGYTVFLTTPLRWITDSVDHLNQGRVSADRVRTFLTLERNLPDGQEGREPAAGAELADPESGLAFPSGTFHAVACAAPSDAAALGDRLGRYVDSAATADGTPLADLSLAAVRERVLIVRNDDYLFAGVLGHELDPTRRASQEQVRDAVATASALEIIDVLPTGLESELQAGGGNFSGGERQRLRLVRALLADPEILVMIEPTSALDGVTEAKVAQQLRDRRTGRTTVVFTTSPAVLGVADRVWYVEDRKVTASGTHETLLRNTRYESLVTRGVDLA